MSDFKRIIHAYDNDRQLHADHNGKRGITEDDIEKVLNSPAYVERDEINPDKFYAAGATRGKNPYLLVVYLETSDDEIFAPTAWPIEKDSRWVKAYLRGRQRGNLWIPAKNTTNP